MANIRIAFFARWNMWPAVVASLAVPIALPLLMRIFRKMAPYQASVDESLVLSPEQLRNVNKWRVIFGVALFPSWALFFFLWLRITGFLSVIAHSSVGPSSFVIFPLREGLIVCSLFLGFVTAGYVTNYLFSLLLGAKHTELLHYDNISSGMDNKRVWRWMAVGIGTLCVCFTFLALSCYTRFLEDSIVVKPFAAFSKRKYKYSEIAEIRQIAAFRAPMGNIAQKPHYQLVFSDGYLWSTRGNLRTPDVKTDDEIMNFVSQRAAKPIVRYELPPE